MAYNLNLPADTTAPAEIRENFRALKEDKIVAAATAVTADSATKLTNARVISLTGDATGSATFDGSADVSIAVDVVSADVSASCTGNAASATKLETARNINGVAFDGSADIIITQVYGKDIATTDLIQAAMPAGAIIIWSGSIATIPTGWQLCDGSNGTPDLRSRFIVGAGSDTGSYTAGTNGIGTGYYTPGAIGGEDLHQLIISEMPSHSHRVLESASGDGSYHGFMVDTSIAYNYIPGSPSFLQATGGGQAHENRPPYYALAYIMRIA